MTWTKEFPTVEGYYWVRSVERYAILTDSPTDEVELNIVSIAADGDIYVIGSEGVSDSDDAAILGWEFWSDPISPPGDI